MNDPLTIECGPADANGRRVVMAACGPQEHRDYFQTDEAFRRRKFAEAMIEKFGWAMTQEMLAEIQERILAAADREDARTTPSGPLGIESVRVADVPKSQVAWLWPGRIALGKLTLLAGDPGLGKSFVTLDIASRVSRGASWPDVDGSGGTPGVFDGRGHRAAYVEPYPTPFGEPQSVPPTGPASVILLSAEDDVADTIRPRLEAHRADCERIHVIRSVAAIDAKSPYGRSFDLGRDLEHLCTLLDRLPDCRLLVIDPMSAYLGRNVENANSEVRSLLGPLAALASERNLAVLAVTHLRKEEGAAMYRTMGSMAFIAAARAAWVVCKDKDDSRRRLLLPVKNNLANDTTGLAYTIEPRGVNGEPIVCWSSDAIEVPADIAMERPTRPVGRPSGERDDIIRWLAEFLATGPQPAAVVRAAATGQGFTSRTLRRAFEDLGGVANRVAGKNEWQWSLPTTGSAWPVDGVDVNSPDTGWPTQAAAMTPLT